MSKLKKQRYSGVVYSTDNSFDYVNDNEEIALETLPPDKQKLRVLLDKKARKGKMVTLVTGFVGTEQDLEGLGRMLKQKCAVGGSMKDGEIIIQGDFRNRIQDVLQQQGYNVKIVG